MSVETQTIEVIDQSMPAEVAVNHEYPAFDSEQQIALEGLKHDLEGQARATMNRTLSDNPLVQTPDGMIVRRSELEAERAAGRDVASHNTAGRQS